MATGIIILPIGAAIPGDGSTNNAAAAISRVKSSAAAPSPIFLEALFDATTKEMLHWAFVMPDDYGSAPLLVMPFKMASAVTGAVVFDCRIAAVTPTDATDVDAKAYASANLSSSTTVPATTAGKLGSISITLTNADSLAAGDLVILTLARIPADAGDTAAGDVQVPGAVVLKYTTA